METTQTNIIESGNRLIAIFDGYKEDENGRWWKNKAWARLPSIRYNLDWGRLMPVLEKICRMRIGDGITRVDYACPRTFGMLNENSGQIMVRLNGFVLHEAETLIEATWNAVVEFIEHHNQLTQNKER